MAEQTHPDAEVFDAASRSDDGRTVLERAGLADESGISRMLDRAGELLHEEPFDAGRLIDLAEVLAAEHGWPALRARACYQSAQLLADRGELQLSLDALNAAQELWLAAGDQLAALRTGLGRMQVLDDLGRHDDAVTIGRRVLDALDELDDPADRPVDEVRAIAMENLGVAHGFRGQHAEALAAYARAEAAYRRLGLRAARGRALANRGVELLALGRAREAIRELERAVAVFAAEHDRLFQAQCMGDLAQAHRQLGELAEALRLLEPARQMLRELGAGTEAVRLHLVLAETYLALGLLNDAKTAADTAFAQSRRAAMTHDTAHALFLIGMSELGRDHADAAATAFDHAARLFAEVVDPQQLARVDLARAELLIRNADSAGARTLLEATASRLMAGGWAIELAWSRLRLADLADTDDAAAAILDQAADAVVYLKLPDLSFQHRLRRGRVQARQGHLVAAERQFRSAIEDCDRSSRNLPDHVLATAYRADRLAAHDALVSLLIDRGSPDDAAAARSVADRAKARTLIDLGTDAVGRGPALVSGDPELAEAYADLNLTYVLLHQATAAIDRRLLAQRAAELERRVSLVRLRSAATQRPTIQPASWGLTSDVAVTDGPVVSYHVLEDDLAIFAERPGTLIARRVPNGARAIHAQMSALERQWRRCSIGLEVGLRSENLLRATQATLREMYTVLLDPIAELLDATDTFTVVPDGRLGAVPFQALYDGSGYLLERMAVIVAPTLAGVGGAPGAALTGARALVVAVPDAFAPAVAREADLVARTAPGAVVLTGKDASADAFLAAASEAEMLHVACHGVHAATNPLFSRLRLADRWLTSAEIVRMQLRARLVTLSACESGVHGRATEPVGLGWAFLAAGADRVIVSQWSAHDEATLTVMAALYGELAAGRTPPQALRAAQLRAAQTYQHPFFWAQFSLVANVTGQVVTP